MKIIAANWKMNHVFDEVDSWLERFFKNSFIKPDSLKNVEVILCPPVFMIDYIDSELMDDGFRNLESIMAKDQKQIGDFSTQELTEIVLKNRQIKLGGQDCHHELNGSFTGDISATMLKAVGCEYVILGHSERRAGHFETSDLVSKKVRAALSQNLIPIICVGEDQKNRDNNTHLEFVYKQIMSSIPQDVKFKKLIIAYEPIWSIGSGTTPAMAQIGSMAKLIKKICLDKLSNIAEEYVIIYGGSVTAQNAKEILAIPNIDGLLVGKASLDADEFFQICTSLSAFG
jgi:triosephosphate isomerase (TIM)